MTKAMCVWAYWMYLCFWLGFTSPNLIDLLLKFQFLSQSPLAAFLIEKEKEAFSRCDSHHLKADAKNRVKFSSNYYEV